jgi:hypothetical protein
LSLQQKNKPPHHFPLQEQEPSIAPYVLLRPQLSLSIFQHVPQCALESNSKRQQKDGVLRATTLHVFRAKAKMEMETETHELVYALIQFHVLHVLIVLSVLNAFLVVNVLNETREALERRAFVHAVA